MTQPVLKITDDKNHEMVFVLIPDGAEIDGVQLLKKDVSDLASALNRLPYETPIGEVKLRTKDLILSRTATTFKITTSGPSMYILNVNGEIEKFEFPEAKIVREYIFSILLAEKLSEVIFRILYQVENQNLVASRINKEISQNN